GWDLLLQDISFDWQGGQRWPGGDISASYRRSGQDDGASLDLQADVLDTAILSALLQIPAQVPDSAKAALLELNPGGQLHKLSLRSQWRNAALESLSISSNIDSARVNAFRGVPALWGVDGYAEFDYQASLAQATALVEVDAESLMLHLPGMFQDPWAYERVNGRVHVAVDMKEGMHVRVSSGVIHAESGIIDGHAQFAVQSARDANGEHT